MAKLKPKRDKKYRPKYVARNPMHTFFGGMSGAHAEEATELMTKNSLAMQAMVRGVATRENWNQLTGAINMAAVMCEQGVGPEYRWDVLAARDAMLEVGKRAMPTDRFIFKGDEMRVLNEFMSIHEAQISAVRAIDIDRAAAEVIRRVRHRINSTSVAAEVAREAA